MKIDDTQKKKKKEKKKKKRPLIYFTSQYNYTRNSLFNINPLGTLSRYSMRDNYI